MKFFSLSRKKKFGFFLFAVSLLLVVVYFSTTYYVNIQLDKRISKNIYNDCHKVWATRGLVDEGLVNSAKLGNSIKTVKQAINAGAKGSEIDVFFDPALGQYIVSHDYPYNLKEGKLLTLSELLNEIDPSFYIWLDLKKLSRLTQPQMKSAVARLTHITKQIGVKDRLYIEGEDPINLSYFNRSGFNTIFDTRPLPESNWLSTFVINVYKIAYYFNDFTVMSLNSGSIEQPIYGEKTEQLLINVPLFLYHVPDEIARLQHLSEIENIRVILDTNHASNQFHINSCY